MPGVKIVRDGDFIGVVAPDAFTAHRAAAMITVNWDVPEQPSNENLFEYLKKNLETSEPRRADHETGSVDEAMRTADIKIERALHRPVHCACASGAARGSGGVD